MSGYGDGEALIEAIVKGVTGFTTTGQVARGNWKPINSGRGDRYAILKPRAAGRRVMEGHNLITEPWITEIEVWHRYKDDGTTLTNLESYVDSIVSAIDAKPRLGDTANYVTDSNVTEIGEVEEMWRKGGGPAWLRQVVTVEWVGQRTITFT